MAGAGGRSALQEGAGGIQLGASALQSGKFMAATAILEALETYCGVLEGREVAPTCSRVVLDYKRAHKVTFKPPLL